MLLCSHDNHVDIDASEADLGTFEAICENALSHMTRFSTHVCEVLPMCAGLDCMESILQMQDVIAITSAKGLAGLPGA